MKISRLAITAIAVMTGLGVVAAPVATAGTTPTAAVPIATEQAICTDVYGGIYALPSSEPLAQCQWDMALINADQATRARATGEGVRVGIIDSGVDINHPDIAPNLDLASSCSFVASDDPTIIAGPHQPDRGRQRRLLQQGGRPGLQRARDPRRLDRRRADQRHRDRRRRTRRDDRRAQGLHRVDVLLRLRGRRRAAVRR